MATLENRLKEVDQQSKGDLEAVEEQLKVTFQENSLNMLTCFFAGPPEGSRGAGTSDGVGGAQS